MVHIEEIEDFKEGDTFDIRFPSHRLVGKSKIVVTVTAADGGTFIPWPYIETVGSRSFGLCSDPNIRAVQNNRKEGHEFAAVFPLLSPGAYLVGCSASEYLNPPAPPVIEYLAPPVAVNLSPGETRRMHLVMEPSKTVEGTLEPFDEENPCHLICLSGTSATGAVVEREVEPDEKGSFSLYVPSGAYVCQAVSHGGVYGPVEVSVVDAVREYPLRLVRRGATSPVSFKLKIKNGEFLMFVEVRDKETGALWWSFPHRMWFAGSRYKEIKARLREQVFQTFLPRGDYVLTYGLGHRPDTNSREYRTGSYYLSGAPSEVKGREFTVEDATLKVELD